MLATIIIPNYNGRRWLPRLMESLARQTERRFTTIVVDDASTDDSVAYLRANWPTVAPCGQGRRLSVEVICSERNRGFAATCNAGMRAARTPFVVLLNNDTHVDPNWMAEGLRAFDSPSIAAVASLVLLAEPPHLIDTAGDLYSVAGGALKRGHGRPREFAAALGREVFSASGASAFYRREAAAGVGWLDETFESYYEDVDLSFRLAWAGHRCVFAPASICYHHLSSSYGAHGWRYHYNSARNAEIVWWANLPRRLRRRYLPAHAAFLLLQGLNKLRQGCLSPYVAGKWAALRSAAEIRRKRAEIIRLGRASDRSGPPPARREGEAPAEPARREARPPEPRHSCRASSRGVNAAAPEPALWAAGFPANPESRIEALLVRDWWGLHVRSRLPQPGEPGHPAAKAAGPPEAAR